MDIELKNCQEGYIKLSNLEDSRIEDTKCIPNQTTMEYEWPSSLTYVIVNDLREEKTNTEDRRMENHPLDKFVSDPVSCFCELLTVYGEKICLWMYSFGSVFRILSHSLIFL